jgi:hypothetical protein
LRDKIDVTFKSGETTKDRSVRKNDVAIKELCDRVTSSFTEMDVVAKPLPKKFPLLFAFQKLRKKINKIKSKYLKFDKVENFVIGEDGDNLDDIEREIL